MLNALRLDAVVIFVDMCGIVGHYYLKIFKFSLYNVSIPAHDEIYSTYMIHSYQKTFVRDFLGQTKDYKIGICCFYAKLAALRRKSKDWLARNQNNVSEWSDIFYPRTVVSVS